MLNSDSEGISAASSIQSHLNKLSFEKDLTDIEEAENDDNSVIGHSDTVRREKLYVGNTTPQVKKKEDRMVKAGKKMMLPKIYV